MYGNRYGQGRRQSPQKAQIGFKQIGQYVFKPDKLDKKHYLGGGAFGQVYKGYHTKTKKEVAVKVVAMSSLGDDGGTAKKEIALFRELAGKFNHENILKIYKIYQTRNSLYVVMEMCRSGDLEGLIKKKGKIGEDESIKVLKATIEGLAYLN